MKKIILILMALIFAGFSLIVFFDIDLKGGKDSAETVSFRLNSGEQVSGRVVERNDSCIVLGSSWLGRREYPYNEILADTLQNMLQGRMGAKIAGRWGYLDKRGRVAIAPVYLFTWSFNENLAPVMRTDSMFGYIDTTGHVRLPFDYEYAWVFSEGAAHVRYMGKMVFIDSAGRVLFHTENDVPTKFSEGLAACKKHGKWGFVDRQGKIVIPTRYEEVYPFRDSLAKVRKGKLWGFIDHEGNTVIDFRYIQTGQFSGGYTWVMKYPEKGFRASILVDKNGRQAIDTLFTVAGEIRYSLVPLSFMYRDDGEIRVSGFYWDLDRVERLSVNEYNVVFPFTEGLAPVRIREKMGYIDTTGNLVIEALYDDANNFSEGVASVIVDGRWLILNRKGETVYGI